MGDNKCCKACTVEKFKYIIEKYVRTTSINLPSAIQRKLISIWNELQIKDPEKRFMDKKSLNKKENKKENIKKQKQTHCKQKSDEMENCKHKINTKNTHSKERENSKSKSHQIITASLSVIRRISNAPSTPKLS